MTTAVRRSVIAVLLLVVALAVVGLTRLDGRDGVLPVAENVPQVTPEANEQVPRQGQVRVRLRPGWAARLQIDQIAIPDGQLTSNAPDKQLASYQQLTFQPGPGKVLEYFPPGQNCATLTYWQVATGPQQSFTKTWCFSAV